MDFIGSHMTTLSILIGVAIILGFGISIIIARNIKGDGTASDKVTSIEKDIYDFIGAVYGSSTKLVEFAIESILAAGKEPTDVVVLDIVDEVIEKFFNYVLNNPAKYPELIKIVQSVGKDRLKIAMRSIVIHIIDTAMNEIRKTIADKKAPVKDICAEIKVVEQPDGTLTTEWPKVGDGTYVDSRSKE